MGGEVEIMKWVQLRLGRADRKDMAHPQYYLGNKTPWPSAGSYGKKCSGSGGTIYS